MSRNRKRFRVTVKAIDAANAETVVGTIVIESEDRKEAAQQAIAKLWTKEHAATGARADAHCERISGEGA